MKTVSELTFKNSIAEIFRELEATGEELLVMANGQMALKIISYRRELIPATAHSQDHEITR